MSCFCIIYNLMESPFSRRSIAEKKDLIQFGKPTPNLVMEQVAKVKTQT